MRKTRNLAICRRWIFGLQPQPHYGPGRWPQSAGRYTRSQARAQQAGRKAAGWGRRTAHPAWVQGMRAEQSPVGHSTLPSHAPMVGQPGSLAMDGCGMIRRDGCGGVIGALMRTRPSWRASCVAARSGPRRPATAPKRSRSRVVNPVFLSFGHETSKFQFL